MNEVIFVKPEKCVGCNACIRSCPALEANITRKLDNGRYITSVNPEKCIGCGECVKVCAHGARDFIDDTEECMARISKEKVIIIASPAIKSFLPNKWKGILDWFKQQGCSVYDASFGADICTWTHLRAMEQNKINKVISPQCPAIVKYIETYQPTLLSKLSPIHSPEMCTAIYVRQYEKLTNTIAVLSPCVAKKIEFEASDVVDYNVTFKKLLEYFEQNAISIPINSVDDFEYNFDGNVGQMGSVYSRPGGLRENLLLNNPKLSITSSCGVQKVYRELDIYAKTAGNKQPDVFDLISCEYGCNGGPAVGSTQSIFDINNTMEIIEYEAMNRREAVGGFRSRGEDKLMKEFDENLGIADFLRNYKPSMLSQSPTDKQLDEIYKKLGKTTDADKQIDCNACGYGSCRGMAVSIYRGLNVPENCAIYMRNSGGSGNNEKYEKISEDCLKLSEDLSESLKNINTKLTGIKDTNSSTSETTDNVKNLLQNVVDFCNDNQTMDADSVQQLVGILETTLAVFNTYEENVTATNDNSSAINASLDKMKSLIENINKTLKSES